jgi:hypothetical protein
MKRILQLDFFRGLFLVVMTTDHFISKSNILKRFTSEFIGWITAAEGFILLSGFTAGLIYTHNYKNKGETFIFKAARKRAWTIYKYHVCLLFFIIACLYIFPYMGSYWKDQYMQLFQKPELYLLLTPLLLYQPIFFDILPMYAIFIFLVPIAIKQFQSDRIWPLVLLSFSLYLLCTFWLNEYYNGALTPLIWQLLFLIGSYFGFLFYSGKLKNIHEKTTIFFICCILSILFFIVKNLKIQLPGFDIQYWTHKSHLRPLRLVNIASLTFIMTFIVSKYKSKFTFRPLCYLGKYSLQVFTWHVLLIYMFYPIKKTLNEIWSIPINNFFKIYPLETLLLLLVLLLLFAGPVVFLSYRPKNFSFRSFQKV